jgi:hypothetical protein
LREVINYSFFLINIKKTFLIESYKIIIFY